MRVYATDDVFIDASPRAIHRRLMALGDDASWWPGARARGGDGWIEISARAGRPLARVRFRARIDGVRDAEGISWTIEDGELQGRAEWWLEPLRDGTLVHYHLDVERGSRGRARRLSSIVRRHRWAVRSGVNALKDLLEGRGR